MHTPIIIAYFKQFVNTRNILILANILLVFFLILLSNLNVLPVKSVGDFVFFAVLAFIFALYRPGWAFLFFVGTVAFENINLAPAEIGINIRPYQFIGGLTILAVLIRYFTKRLNFALPKWNFADAMILIFTISGFISALFQGSTLTGSKVEPLLNFKQLIIVASFAALYFLVRVFVQNFEDLKKIIPFFLSSSVMIIFYGIWQNIRFMRKLSHFEIMPGRPNGTFSEADWLGIYLVLLLAVIYSMIYYFNQNGENTRSQISNSQFLISNKFPIHKFLNFKTFLYLILSASYILLILTVSRSAWLGALAVSSLFVVFSFWFLVWKNKNSREFLKQVIFLAIAGVASIAIVYFFNLTSFQLFNRAQSTGTGLQKITLSCKDNQQIKQLPQIERVEQLEQFDCRHINLEEIENEKALGNNIVEVYRIDPNINIRKEIYQKSWTEIRRHPIMGIGWGNISSVLGEDDRGAGLNSSNIFLEVWLGSGILGVLVFLTIWISVIIMSSLKILKEEKVIGVFMLLGAIAILIPNLFNAGIMLGFVWFYLATAVSLTAKNK